MKTDEKTAEPILPHFEHANLITACNLARLLVLKDVISADEFGELVTLAFVRDRALAMNENNWQKIKKELLDFLKPLKAPDDPKTKGKPKADVAPTT